MQRQTSQITQLPEPATRNFQSIFVIVPGFSPPASSHSEAGNPQGALATDVNGASYNNNATRIDGALDLYPWLPEIVAYVPSTEAIETVSVVTASFDAEQGMAGGSAVNISIKSGTNSFHGAAWEFNQISALKARNYFYYGANNPKNIINQFGGNLGGPIIKNKLFFFGSWEVTDRRANVSALETVATDPLRQGQFESTGTNIYDPLTGLANGTGRTVFAGDMVPSSRFATASVKMMQLMPEPNQVVGSQHHPPTTISAAAITLPPTTISIQRSTTIQIRRARFSAATASHPVASSIHLAWAPPKAIHSMADSPEPLWAACRA